jgi:diguanylate cyclase (GGDEF)-like protein/PAS domain S-box-containing protein
VATIDHHKGPGRPALPGGLARSLVEHSRDGLVVIDAAGLITFSSPAAEQMLGYAPGAVLGLNAFDLVHPEDQVAALEGFESTMSSRDSRPLPLLVRLRRADGSWHQTELIGTNVLDDEHIGGLLLNIRDVTDSMRTEAALRESEERHRLIVELAREGIWLIDASGHTTFANRALAAMLETTVTDLLGCTIFDFLADDGSHDASGGAPPHELASGEYEVRLVTKRGQSLWTRINSSPIFDSRNRYVGAVALVTDITERRSLERSLALAARRDPLTGVANRLELFERLSVTLGGGALVTALYVDLDHFKHVNDNHGHAIGDGVLHAAAGRLCRSVRSVDLVARMGGDEFVIVSDGIEGPDAALSLGNRVCHSLQRAFSIDELEVSIGASVGIAFARGGDPDELLSRADEALYRAKRAGRGRVELANVLVA